ncbi:hypothetical protein D3C86_1933230 [compost metagenome]
MLAHALVERPDVELDERFIRDDVLLGAGMQDADREHGGIGRGHLARDDGLQPEDRRGGHDDRIDACLRHRPMRAPPEQADLQAISR